MDMTSDCPFLVDTGVYLLGALVPPERADFAGHLRTCPACRRELDELAHLPALLRRVTALFGTPGEGDPPSSAVPDGV
jgi:anti-sigma factor RsiW